MRIKKTSQYIEGGANLSTIRGTSNTDGYTQSYINGLTDLEQVTPTDYITLNNSFTVASTIAYRTGNIVFYFYDITGGTINNGMTVLGSCSDKLAITSYGSARAVTSNNTAYPATVVAIPSGDFRIHASSASVRTTGSVILLVND